MTDMTSIPLNILDRPDKSATTDHSTRASYPQHASITNTQDERQPMTKSRGAAAFLAWFTQGVNDAVTGALLPYIEAHYNLGYAVASLIFVANAVGFIAAAPLVQLLDRRFGRSKTLFSAAFCNAVAYAVIISQPPFAVVAVFFVVLGFNFSIVLALDNSYVANVQNENFLMGIMQGGYGLGGTIAPLIGTAMASHGVGWSFFYFFSLALCVGGALLMGWAFRDYEAPKNNPILPPSPTSGRVDNEKSLLKRAIKDRTTLLGALFIFAYQGAEVTLSGWVVSFLIDYRNGDPARVGYVTAGFWAGITVGRFLLCAPIYKVGARFSVPALIVVWACLHVAIWLSKDIIGDAVTVAIIGLLTGPIAPVATSVLSRLLDPRIQMLGISIGWSVGSGGAAVAPFITGVLSQKFGTVVLNPVAIVLCVIMQGSWFGLPFRSQWKSQ